MADETEEWEVRRAHLSRDWCIQHLPSGLLYRGGKGTVRPDYREAIRTYDTQGEAEKVAKRLNKAASA